MKLDELLSSIADYTHDAIMVTEVMEDETTGPNIVYVNPSFTKLTGYEYSDVMGKTPRILQGPKTDRTQLDRIREAVEKHEPVEVELVNYTKKKHAYWVEISISPVFDESGKCTHFVSIEKDITDRKVMQEATEQQSMEFLLSEAKTRAILYSIEDAIITFEPDGSIERFSPSAEQMFGYESSAVQGKKLPFLFDPEHADVYWQWFDDFAQGKKEIASDQTHEVQGKRNNGELFLAELSLRKVDAGNKTLIVAAVRDVTELKAAEEEARIQNKLVKLMQHVATAANTANSIEECFSRSMELICKHFKWVLSHSYLYNEKRDLLESTGLWYVSDSKQYQLFMDNSRITEFTPGSGMVGKAYMLNQAMILPDLSDSKKFLRADAAQQVGIQSAYAFPIEIGGNVVAVLEFFGVHPWCPSLDELHLMENIGNQIGRVIERKKNEAEMIEARDAAEASTRAKSEFLANMSHELRTPMNGILGLAELLKDTQLDVSQRESLEVLHGSASSLLEILNDILDFSKIEAGELKLHEAPFSIFGLIDKVQDLLGPMAECKGVEFCVKTRGPIANAYLADASRLQQVLINLLGNAIKFTQAGSVTLQLTCQPQDTGGHTLAFEIQDTGIGIAPEYVPTVFHKFTQADNSNTRKFGGTGLGLAITKQLVELMQGRIGVESVLGEGSTFWFEFPAKQADASLLEVQAQAPLSVNATDVANASILVVEDHPVNAMVLNKLLNKLGIQQFDVAENGALGLEAVQSKSYDLILMDCQMPVMDGYDATKAIREHQQPLGRHTPIIAMTANAMVGDREKCLDAGMDDYISKPIDSRALMEAIGRWLRFDSNAAQMLESQVKQDEKASKTPTDMPVDMEHLRVFTDGDEAEEQMLFEVFLQSAADSLSMLGECATEQNNDEWRKAAHRMKGAAGNLGAHDLHQACLQAEQDHEGDAQSKRNYLECIVYELERVRHFIKAHSNQLAA